MKMMIFTPTDALNPTSRLGLAEARRAVAAGHEVLLVGKVFARGPAPLTPLGSEADRLGIPFRVLQQRFNFDPGLLGQMELLFTRHKPTVFQSHDLVGMALYRMGRWRPPVWQAVYHGFPHPLEIESRGDFAGTGLRGALRRKLELSGLSHADAVFAANEAAAAPLLKLKWAEKKMRVLEPGELDSEANLDALVSGAHHLAAKAPRR